MPKRPVEEQISDPTKGTSSLPTNVFLDWNQPVLEATTKTLFQRFCERSTNSLARRKTNSSTPRSETHSNATEWDLRNQVVVLSSSLACRRLSEMLALYAAERKVVLHPPEIVTIGALPEMLYVAKQPFASQIVQHLAWKEVLQSTPPKELAHLIPSQPTGSNTTQWIELGRSIASVHQELSAEGLSFKSVLHKLPDAHPEHKRWQVLADLQRRYLKLLDKLELWDIQTARLFALDHFESETQKRIIVVGCVDLNTTQRGFLKAVAEQVEVWIACKESQQGMFDETGCLIPEAWNDATLKLNPEHLFVGNSPVDQAELATACVAQFGDRFHQREVTIGIPEPSLVAELKHQFDLSGVTTRNGAGTSLANSEPMSLLSLVARFLDGRSYLAFSALIRHPAVTSLLLTLKVDLPETWLTDVDSYYQEALPKQVEKFVCEKIPGAETYAKVTRAVERWLSKLPKRSQPIGNHVQPLLNLLANVYDRVECDLEDPVEGPLYSAAKATAAAYSEVSRHSRGVAARRHDNGVDRVSFA